MTTLFLLLCFLSPERTRIDKIVWPKQHDFFSGKVYGEVQVFGSVRIYGQVRIKKLYLEEGSSIRVDLHSILQVDEIVIVHGTIEGPGQFIIKKIRK